MLAAIKEVENNLIVNNQLGMPLGYRFYQSMLNFFAIGGLLVSLAPAMTRYADIYPVFVVGGIGTLGLGVLGEVLALQRHSGTWWKDIKAKFRSSKNITFLRKTLHQIKKDPRLVEYLSAYEYMSTSRFDRDLVSALNSLHQNVSSTDALLSSLDDNWSAISRLYFQEKYLEIRKRLQDRLTPLEIELLTNKGLEIPLDTQEKILNLSRELHLDVMSWLDSIEVKSTSDAISRISEEEAERISTLEAYAHPRRATQLHNSSIGLGISIVAFAVGTAAIDLNTLSHLPLHVVSFFQANFIETMTAGMGLLLATQFLPLIDYIFYSRQLTTLNYTPSPYRQHLQHSFSFISRAASWSGQSLKKCIEHFDKKENE